MLIAREFVAYLSRQVAKRLTPTFIETANPQALTDLTTNLIIDELEVEDRLNDEVRDILGQYSDYMREQGVSYQEMFRRIKNTLITQRKVIRASGRDSGDHMKLSRDKVTDISHKLVTALRKSRDPPFKTHPHDVRPDVAPPLKALTAACCLARLCAQVDRGVVEIYSSGTVVVGTTRQFQVYVGDITPTTVTWSVNDIPGGNSTIGTISPAGLYTAPPVAPTPNAVT